MSALHKAADELKKEMDQWGVSVQKGRDLIFRGNAVTPVPQYAPRKECRLRIKRVIKLAQEEHFEKTQETLL